MGLVNGEQRETFPRSELFEILYRRHGLLGRQVDNSELAIQDALRNDRGEIQSGEMDDNVRHSVDR